jgi:hypothetical protein
VIDRSPVRTPFVHPFMMWTPGILQAFMLLISFNEENQMYLNISFYKFYLNLNGSYDYVDSSSVYFVVPDCCVAQNKRD